MQYAVASKIRSHKSPFQPPMPQISIPRFFQRGGLTTRLSPTRRPIDQVHNPSSLQVADRHVQCLTHSIGIGEENPRGWTCGPRATWEDKQGEKRGMKHFSGVALLTSSPNHQQNSLYYVAKSGKLQQQSLPSTQAHVEMLSSGVTPLRRSRESVAFQFRAQELSLPGYWRCDSTISTF